MGTLGEMPCRPSSVLLVEDHEETADFLRLFLEQDGYSVTHVADGGLAHHLISTTTAPPDLVLLDHMLPSLTGLELLRIIRTTPEWQWIPVILLTADSRPETRAEAVDLGATAYMEKKPFVMNRLLNSIRMFLPIADGPHAHGRGNPLLFDSTIPDQ
jgi:DNA-binding response OmpR family regulator